MLPAVLGVAIGAAVHHHDLAQLPDRALALRPPCRAVSASALVVSEQVEPTPAAAVAVQGTVNA